MKSERMQIEEDGRWLVTIGLRMPEMGTNEKRGNGVRMGATESEQEAVSRL